MQTDRFLQYLSLEKKYSLHTCIGYKKDLEEFFDFLEREESSTDDCEITTLVIRNYLYHLSKKMLSARSINRKLSSIKSYFKFLLKTQQIAVNPANSLESLKTIKTQIIPISELEMQQTANTTISKDEKINTRNQLIIEIFYQTGIRRAELKNLQLKNIDFANELIKVTGKRNKERIIPISKELLMIIGDFVKSNSITEFLFISNKNQPITERTIHNIVAQKLAKITTKQKISPHILRHTFATHLLQNDAELTSVKELLGHTSLAATQVYTHQNIENLKKVFNQTHPRELQKSN